MKQSTRRSPWAWIPTLYFAQGLPYVAVMTISVIMYKRLGISNTDIALYTGWLNLPWVIKPFWSPFVDIIKTKRWWTLSMQWIIAFALAGIAFSIPTPFFFQLTLAVFWLVGFTSATHDIAADGFYMLALDEHEQSLYVGIRSTFYRVATVAGQGLLVIIAGLIEVNSGLEPLRVTVNADPAVEWSAPSLDADPAAEPGLAGEMQFVTPAVTCSVGVNAPSTVTHQGREMAFADYASMMRDSVARLNEAAGFVAPAKADGVAVAAAKAPAESAFTAWVRNTFGESRPAASERASNAIAIVPVTLSAPPAPGETVVLNVTHHSGDPSVKLEQDKLSTRFEFNEHNWNKTAWLYYEIDHKLSAPTSATFEGASGNIPMAWLVVFVVLSCFFFAVALYHSWALPRPADDHGGSGRTASDIIAEFLDTFKSFFCKPGIVPALAFMLLYRLPEAQLVKLINPFLLDPIDRGGLGLTTGEVGIVYGTVGIIGLTIGGIVGGIAAARGGLRRWLWPMAVSMSLTCLTFVYLAYFPTSSLLTVNLCVFVEQFGYGFGFTAYMLYLIYFSEGRHKTAHYAICTGFMALGMMLPGMAAGWLQETIGYRHFFVWTMICCVATIVVCAFLKIDPQFGLKKTKK